MDEPDNIVVEMSIASAQEDERIKATEFDRMIDQATKNGFDTNIQYDETAPPPQPTTTTFLYPSTVWLHQTKSGRVEERFGGFYEKHGQNSILLLKIKNLFSLTALTDLPYQKGLNNIFLVLDICIGCKFLTNQCHW